MNNNFIKRLENKYNIIIINFQKFSGSYKAIFKIIGTNFEKNIIVLRNETYEEAIEKKGIKTSFQIEKEKIEKQKIEIENYLEKENQLIKKKMKL